MNILSRIQWAALAFLTLGGANSARAEDFTFSGFGTVGYAVETHHDIGFFANVTQPTWADRQGSFMPDSVLGLQGTYRITPELEVVAQLVGRQRFHSTLANSFEWAFVGYHPNAATDLRVGRVGLDMFMLSEYRNLGFSQLWVRPPTEFYGWLPVFSIDGGDAAYQFRQGDTLWRAKVQAGKAKVDIPLRNNDPYRFETSGLWNVSLQAEYGPWRAKAAYASFDVASQPPLDPLTNNLNNIARAGLGPFSAEAAALSRDLTAKGTPVTYQMVGAAYDDGTWQVQGEYARVSSTATVIPFGDAMYVSAGRRFGNLTPYAVYSEFKSRHPVVRSVNNWTLIGAQTLQAQAVSVANFSRIEQETVSLGMRWDVSSRVAAKFQWDRTHIHPNSYGLWQVNTDRSLRKGEAVNLLSATLDFVF